jgi:hypothetical protein
MKLAYMTVLLIALAGCAVPALMPVPVQCRYSSSHIHDGLFHSVGEMVHGETGGRQ